MFCMINKSIVVLIGQLLCILLENTFHVRANICEVGQVQDDGHVWRWALSFGDPCQCKNIGFGGASVGLPSRALGSLFFHTTIDDGKLNCKDIDECLNRPCDTNGVCSNNPGSFDCTCNEGFSGDGFNCTDDDECLNDPCDANAACDNIPGSYECTCYEGFTGDGSNCADDDECLDGPCDANAYCHNIPGSYECICKEGFTGDGSSCVDDDECLNDPCDANAACSNIPGSFECTCNDGFTGDGSNCADDNECLDEPCHINAVCSNIPGSFKCTCNEGFTGEGSNCSVCMNYMGMKDGTIPDASITASRSANGQPPEYGRLNKSGGLAWGARPDVKESHWIQADIGYLTFVTGLITQGDGFDNDWVTKFQVSTFLSSEGFEVFVTDVTGNVITFPGNSDIHTAVTTTFPVPIFARIVRITCLEKPDDKYQIRFEILGCKLFV